MAVRLRDLLGPELDRVRQVIDLSAGADGLHASLRLTDPSTVDIVRSMPPAGAGSGDLVLMALAAGQIDANPTGELARTLAALEVGALCALLVEVPPAELAVPVVVDVLARARCQVLTAVPLVGPGLPVGLLVERVDAVRPVRGYLLDTDSAAPPDVDPAQAMLRATLRVYVENQLSALQSRAQRAEWEAAQGDRRTEPDAAVTAALRRDHDALRRDHDALRRDHDALRRDRDALRARLTTLESSAALGAGQALVRAAKHPVRGSVTLPRDLIRLRRARRRGTAAR